MTAPLDEDDTQRLRMGETTWVLVLGERQWPLAPGTTTIGRAPDAAVRIDDPSVSRQHAKIVVDARGARLIDAGSRNGMRVNRAVVSGEVPLSHGDRIEIGAHVLQLMDRGRRRREHAVTAPQRVVVTQSSELRALEARRAAASQQGSADSTGPRAPVPLDVTAEHPLPDDDD